MPNVTAITLVVVLVFAFVASAGWHLGARLVAWACEKRA